MPHTSAAENRALEQHLATIAEYAEINPNDVMEDLACAAGPEDINHIPGLDPEPAAIGSDTTAHHVLIIDEVMALLADNDDDTTSNGPHQNQTPPTPETLSPAPDHPANDSSIELRAPRR